MYESCQELYCKVKCEFQFSIMLSMPLLFKTNLITFIRYVRHLIYSVATMTDIYNGHLQNNLDLEHVLMKMQGNIL